MINSKVSNKTGQSQQRGLWDDIVADPGPAVKIAISEAIKNCSLSRGEIVDEMNRLAMIAGIVCGGRSQKVTLAILDKWVAPGSKSHHIPLRMLHIFCRAVKNNLPLEIYSAFFADIRVISGSRFDVLEWAEAYVKNRKNKKTENKLAKRIGL